MWIIWFGFSLGSELRLVEPGKGRGSAFSGVYFGYLATRRN
jgi:hypothetical protein